MRQLHSVLNKPSGLPEGCMIIPLLCNPNGDVAGFAGDKACRRRTILRRLCLMGLNGTRVALCIGWRSPSPLINRMRDWRSRYVCVAQYDLTAASKPNFAYLFKCSHNYYQTCEKSCGKQNCMPKSPLAKLCEVYILLGFHLMAHNGGVDVLRVIRKKSRGFCEKIRGMYET
jgi:hypothetical protein